MNKESKENQSSLIVRHLILAFSTAILSLIFFTHPVQAQSDAPKVEIGGHFTLLNLPRNRQLFDKTALGGGGRTTFNLNNSIAVEGEVNYYSALQSTPLIIDSSGVSGLFGVKAGWRKERMGIFGKVRPGILHYTEKLDPRVVFIIPPPVPQNPHFMIDVGGVLELYPSRRVVIRFDLGDTVIRFRYHSFIPGDFQFTKHNLQFNAGIGFRFM